MRRTIMGDYVERKACIFRVLENVNMYTSGLFEFAAYHPKDSGLAYSIWFDEFGKNKKYNPHQPRVKVSMDNGDLIPISVEEYPQILLKGVRLRKAEKAFHGNEQRKVFEFISINRNVILQHWNHEVDTVDLFNALKSVAKEC